MIEKDLRRKQASDKKGAFTLLEILVAAAVLSVMLVFLFSAFTHTSAVWKRSSDKIESFQQARAAFDVLRQTLSQATLNTYLDYDNANNPKRYLRQSELRFVTGPAGGALPGTSGTGQAIFYQTPTGYSASSQYAGLENLLNTCGFYVQFTTNNLVPPHVTSTANPYRYRLMQLMVPSEQNSIYTASGNSWFSTATNAIPVADNVIALIIRPQDPATATNSPALAPNDSYSYDSTANATANPQPITANQLPPVIQVTLVAVDEASARRLEAGNAQPADITQALAGRFLNPSQFESDLEQVSQSLSDKKINHRIFSSTVPLRESKWTK